MDQFPIRYHGSSSLVGGGAGTAIGNSILSSFLDYEEHEDQNRSIFAMLLYVRERP